MLQQHLTIQENQASDEMSDFSSMVGRTIEIPTAPTTCNADACSVMSDLYFPDHDSFKENDLSSNALGAAPKVISKGSWQKNEQIALSTEPRIHPSTKRPSSTQTVAYHIPLRTIRVVSNGSDNNISDHTKNERFVGVVSSSSRENNDKKKNHEKRDYAVVGPCKISLLGKGSWGQGQRVTFAYDETTLVETFP